MATAIFDTIPNNGTDADFRVWGKGLSDALAAVGMVKTADTGQVNWATVSKPPTNGSLAGYEIWRFNDTLQATAPIFMKIWYGSGNNNQTIPATSIEMGKGSNGTGTITGSLGSYGNGGSMYGSGSTPSPSYVHCSEGTLIFSLFPKITNQGQLLVVERSLSSGGAFTTTTVTWVYMAGIYMRTYSSGVSVPGSVGSLLSCAALPVTGALTAGGTAPVFPFLFADGVSAFWQSKAIFAGYSGDTTIGVPITITGRGTYMPLGPGLISSYMSILMKWS